MLNKFCSPQTLFFSFLDRLPLPSLIVGLIAGIATGGLLLFELFLSFDMDVLKKIRLAFSIIATILSIILTLIKFLM
ncbi:MAG: hypothetical protein K9W45_13080 [Candidatus Heimdallarchaeum aukensis]|uniref:Uncharacterized protein n=1 Tax=Candidatus Heimdallarchaeum aukensis TaxID=2876573 RepID=A0A9Y1BKU9_9ARCH|nr:MAG: hypothetical protein K9W45_13080 [Candidatus Heimdallarchaeum aukensis]